MGTLKKAAQNSGNRQRWDESFKDDVYDIPSKPARNRLYNEVTTVPMHWVEFFSTKLKEKSGYYALCLNWDFENEKAIENGCPMCEAALRVTSYTYGYLINRSEQKKGAGQITVRPVRLTPKCVSDIIKLSDIAYSEGAPEGWDDEDSLPDATDPKFGFDILISKSQNNNKTEYPVHSAEGGKVPLSKDEVRAFKEYAGQVNFAALAKASLPPKAEIAAKLAQLGVIDGGGDSSAKSQKAKEDYSKYDDVPADGDSDPVTPPKKDNKPSGGKPASGNSGKKPAPEKRTSLTDDEPKGKGDKRSLPWEEGEEGSDESERSYSTPDEEDAPVEDDET